MLISFSTKNLKPWELELIEKYPLLYKERDEKNLCWAKDVPAQEYCNLRYGFEFSEGWAKIVDDFSAAATNLIIRIRRTHPKAYIHGCIFKEKCWQLCWQGNQSIPDQFQDEFRTLINDLERKAADIDKETGAKKP